MHPHVPLGDTDPVDSKFSGSDQGVMLAWVKLGRASGVFCILFSDSDARRQVEGIEGVSMVPKPRY